MTCCLWLGKGGGRWGDKAALTRAGPGVALAIEEHLRVVADAFGDAAKLARGAGGGVAGTFDARQRVDAQAVSGAGQRLGADAALL